MTSRQADLICALLIASAFGVAAWLYGALPDAVPIHWNAAGHADGFMAKPWGAFVLPLTTLGTYLLLRVLPAVSPKGFRMNSFIGVYNVIVVAVVGFLLAITILSLLAASGVPLATRRLIPLGRHSHTLDARERRGMGPHAPIRRQALRRCGHRVDDWSGHGRTRRGNGRGGGRGSRHRGGVFLGRLPAHRAVNVRRTGAQPPI